MTCAADRACTLRDAAAADVDAIVALVDSAYRGESSRAGWTTEADLLDGQRTDGDAVAVLLAAPQSHILLLHAGPALRGCVHIERRGDSACLGMFAVAPEFQGRGCGRSLMAHAEREARARWHVTSMIMNVIDVRTDLMAWYARCGYRRTGIHEPFPYGNDRFGVPRRPDLRFERLEKVIA